MNKILSFLKNDYIKVILISIIFAIIFYILNISISNTKTTFNNFIFEFIIFSPIFLLGPIIIMVQKEISLIKSLLKLLIGIMSFQFFLYIFYYISYSNSINELHLSFFDFFYIFLCLITGLITLFIRGLLSLKIIKNSYI